MKEQKSESEMLALHQRAEAMMKPFRYTPPDGVSTSKGIVRLARTDTLRCNVQIVKKDGGENNLHYHANGDSFWMVLKGKVKFYGPDDVVFGEFGPYEGICTPAWSRYWFENTGDGELEILHISGLTKPDIGVSQRIDLEEQRFKIGTGQNFTAEKV